MAGRGCWSADPPAPSTNTEHGSVLIATVLAFRALALGVLGAVYRRLLGML